MREFKSLYDCLIQTKELNKMFPRLSGEWEKDEKKFIQYQKELENLANIKEVDEE